MNFAVQPEFVVRRHFFPLHLKLMLSFLILAAAILAIASFFALNEARDSSARENSSRMNESFQKVKQELDRRVERSLAVVNLAAENPGLVGDIAGRGVVEMGPSTSEDGSIISDRAVASFTTDASAFFRSIGLAALPADRSYSGLTIKDGKPQATTLSPVKENNVTVGLLSVSVDASSAVDMLKGGPDRAYWIFFDGGSRWAGVNGVVSTFTADESSSLATGKPISKETSVEGNSMMTFFYPLSGITGQTISALAIEGPGRTSSQSAASPILRLAVLTVSIGLFIAHYLSRLVSRPVERITEATGRIAAGGTGQLPPQKSQDELALLSTSFNSMFKRYGREKQRGEQMETLLNESQHRIANNLAAVSGVLSIQLTKAESPEMAQMIGDNLARINSIAQVHRLLTGKMKNEIEIVDMLEQVAFSTIAANSGEKIGLEVQGPEIKMPAKRATSLAIIINELIINSIKHGFPEKKPREQISISIMEENGMIEIDYRDNGSGFSGSTMPSREGLGTQIINNIIRNDLSGGWSFKSENGYVANIHFPLVA